MSNSVPGDVLHQTCSVALSADGTKLIAAAVFHGIFVSTNSGATWIRTSAPETNWSSVASSADGSKLVAVAGANTSYAGPIYTSANSGVSWISNNVPDQFWSSVASSADGTILVAVVGFPTAGLIYISTNSGGNWTVTDAPTNNYWTCVTSSADGNKLAVANPPTYIGSTFAPGQIYTSTNTGATWISNNVPDLPWEGIALSADGSRLVAVAQGQPIYTSTNFGTTWMTNNTPNQTWWACASSADGSKLVSVANNGGGIYTSYLTPAPQLNLTPASGQLLLSWLVPSTNVVLQENLDLTTANWVTLTNIPMLNFTNLQNEVILSPANRSGFFRLVTQYRVE